MFDEGTVSLRRVLGDNAESLRRQKESKKRQRGS